VLATLASSATDDEHHVRLRLAAQAAADLE
jgi:hypothetical protein